jgi:Tfp pilus assembly protein PilE
MRGLGLLDLLIIAAVIALLVFAASQDFVRYRSRSPSSAATPSSRATE